MLTKLNKRNRQQSDRQGNRQSGFTLLELTVVLAVIAVATLAFMQWQTRKLNDLEIERRISDLLSVVEQQYRSWANAATWILNESALDYDARLWAVPLDLDDSNPDHLVVVARVPARLATTANLAAIAGPFNADTDVPAGTITLTVQVPAQTSIGDSMLDLDGSNKMRGDIEFVNPRDIMGAGNIASNSVSTDSVQIGSATIDGIKAQLLKEVAEQDCTNGINVNNNVVSCVSALTPPPPPQGCMLSGVLHPVGTVQNTPKQCPSCVPGCNHGSATGTAARKSTCLASGTWNNVTIGSNYCWVRGCLPANDPQCGGGP